MSTGATQIPSGGGRVGVEVLERAQAAVEGGALLHDLMDQSPGAFPGLTAALANYPVGEAALYDDAEGGLIEELDVGPDDELYVTEDGEFYTAETPKHPGSPWNPKEILADHERRATIRTLGALAINGDTKLEKLPVYEATGDKFTIKLIRALRSITKVEAADVHLEGVKLKRGKPVDGTAVFGEMKLTLPSYEEAHLLDGVLGKWLEKGKLKDAASVSIGMDDDRQWVVTVTNSTEHNWRVIESLVGEKYAKLLKSAANTILPEDKKSLDVWEKEDGVTFNQRARRQLVAVLRGYQWLIAVSTVAYSGKYSEKASDTFENEIKTESDTPLGTAAAPVFEVVRRMSNGLSRPIRGRVNREQAKRKRDRLLIEEHINIRRRASKNIAHGPGRSRVAHGGELSVEEVLEEGRGVVEKLKERPILESVQIAAKLALEGVGIPLWVLFTPFINRPKGSGWGIFSDHRALRRQGREALAANQRLAPAIGSLITDGQAGLGYAQKTC